MTTATDIPPTTTRSMGYLMKNYVNYNLWANSTLINWLKTKPAATWDQEVPSSFPSLRSTLLHIWQTERYWFSIIKQEQAPAPDEFTGSTRELFDALLNTSRALAAYIHTLSDKKVQERTLIESPWFQSNFPNFEYIMHVANHSTYHRGQLITMGRQLGFTDAPMTDYNLYNIDGKDF